MFYQIIKIAKLKWIQDNLMTSLYQRAQTGWHLDRWYIDSQYFAPLSMTKLLMESLRMWSPSNTCDSLEQFVSDRIFSNKYTIARIECMKMLVIVTECKSKSLHFERSIETKNDFQNCIPSLFLWNNTTKANYNEA